MSPDSIADQISTFTTIFLGIFIEAVPFLLLGSVAAGIVEEFVSRDELTRIMPPNPILAALMGAFMGLTFPVCECGVVPLTRRLFAKGLPPSAGVAFLLAAPIVNPVVLVSTLAAYGWSSILYARFGFGVVVALAVGLVFGSNPNQTELLVEHHDNVVEHHGHDQAPK
jgi:uncharacterized membrane protein YraQ (UPF0718 family)